MGRVSRRLSDALLWHLVLHRHEHDGIPVRVNERVEPGNLGRVTEALDLIRQVDARGYRQIRRLLPGGIAVVPPQANVGWYDDRRKACFLSADCLARYPKEEIALTIVHEACHARLARWGIGYPEPLRFRVEQMCVRREIAFARRLVAHDASAEGLVASTSRRLEALQPEDYADAEFERQAWQSRILMLRELKALGTPRWLRRWVVLSVRRQRRRRRIRRSARHARKASADPTG